MSAIRNVRNSVALSGDGLPWPGATSVPSTAGSRGSVKSSSTVTDDASHSLSSAPSGDQGRRHRSVVVETLLDELLLDLLAARVEARVLEVLLELEVDRVAPGAVLLDRQDRPVAEA